MFTVGIEKKKEGEYELIKNHVIDDSNIDELFAVEDEIDKEVWYHHSKVRRKL